MRSYRGRKKSRGKWVRGDKGDGGERFIAEHLLGWFCGGEYEARSECVRCTAKRIYTVAWSSRGRAG